MAVSAHGSWGGGYRLQHRGRLAAIVVLLSGVMGCGGDGDPVVRTVPQPDPSDPLFDPAHVVEVSIEMAPADFTALSLQTRSLFSILGDDCLADPFESPFSYFPATVTIDGQTFEQVGVRKKGFFKFREKSLLNNVRGDACSYFSTVLGPGYNYDHRDHFHFDIAQRRKGRVACH